MKMGSEDGCGNVAFPNATRLEDFQQRVLKTEIIRGTMDAYAGQRIRFDMGYMYSGIYGKVNLRWPIAWQKIPPLPEIMHHPELHA